MAAPLRPVLNSRPPDEKITASHQRAEERIRVVECLARTHMAALLRAARRELGPCRDDAEDVVQDALVLMIAGLRYDYEPAHALPTAIRVVQNIARHKVRDRRRLVSLSDTLCTVNKENASERYVEMRAVERCVIERAVDQLTPAERECLCFRFFCGASVADIAAARGVHPQTVKELVRRSLGKLRSLLVADEI